MSATTRALARNEGRSAIGLAVAWTVLYASLGNDEVEIVRSGTSPRSSAPASAPTSGANSGPRG